jgi:histidinol-phosphate aminotransferase
MVPYLDAYPNLIVSQTLSKSFGLAGVRVGLMYANEQVMTGLRSIKMPYNVNTMSLSVAERVLQPEHLNKLTGQVELIKTERFRVLDRLRNDFGNMFELCGGLDANFVLMRVKDAQQAPSNQLANRIYMSLATGSPPVIIRYRGDEPGCEGCLRITIGSPEQNDTFLSQLAKVVSAL